MGSESPNTRFQTLALAASTWICDGLFTSNFDLRMPLADTIIWIDQPRLVCLARAIGRVFRHRRAPRLDMAEGCRETLDFAFYRFIWSYERQVLPRLLEALATHGAHARQIRLRRDREIARFLAQA